MMELAEYRTMRESEDWHWWYAGLRKILARKITDYRPRLEEASLLDIGCGTGGQTTFIKKTFPEFEVTGLDLGVALSHASARGGECRWIEGSANHMPLPASVFDMAVCLDVLSNRGVEEQKTLSEALRVLKPGGVLLANVPAMKSLRGSHDFAVGTSRRYSAREFQEVLRAGGFEILEICYWNYLLLPFIFAARKFSLWGGRKESDLKPVPGWVNEVLKTLMMFERILFRALPFPAGASLFAAARKPF